STFFLLHLPAPPDLYPLSLHDALPICISSNPKRGRPMTATLPLAPAQAVRFHLSLNVSDLSRSVAFYRILFGVEPAKLRGDYARSEEHTSELQSRGHLVCRLLLEKKKK